MNLNLSPRCSTIVLAAAAALVLALLAAVAVAAPRTTVEATIVDCDVDPSTNQCKNAGEPDNLLEYGPGESYTRLGGSGPGGDAGNFQRPRTSSIINFLQLTDFQAIDEESPARVEFLDATQRGPVKSLSAAYRPQESVTVQIVEAMVRQARNTTSPVTGAPLELTILTGDNADSQQYNETRWFIDTLDGHKKVDPNSGVPIPGCEATPGSIYDGVRDSGAPPPAPDDGYYEPDGSTGEKIDGDGYSPDRARNAAETGRDVTVRDFPGLLEVANQPFEATGIDMPWYSAFGNHDALVQGNSPDAFLGPFGTSGEIFNPVFRAAATGCVKVMQLSAGARNAIETLAGTVENLLGSGSLSAAEQRTVDETTSRIARIALQEQRLATCKFGPPKPAGCPADSENPFDGTVEIVPPDERRCHLAKDDGPLPGGGSPPPCNLSWIGQHFRTTGTPVGHGFAARPPQAIANHDGYYSFVPRSGLRFIVLDTITDECGSTLCAEGSVDHAQFQWLDEQIAAAATSKQYVMVFSHHTLRTTRSPDTDVTEQPVHYGQRLDRDNPLNPQNPAGGETLEELYCRHPNVLAHISGHEHENFVRRYKCAADTPPVGLTPGAGFVHVSTAAHIDWPQQSRMIELVDNGEGTGTQSDPGMSLVLTMLDHAGPAFPGQPKPCPDPGPDCELTDGGQAGEQPLKLAGIGRELSYNDYQANRAARGTPQDRNIVVTLDRPWPYQPPAPAPPLPLGSALLP